MPKPKVALINGYLPVRVLLPSKLLSNNDSDTTTQSTFFYVREHHAAKHAQDKAKSNGATLFVANAPIVPGVSTELLLKSLLGRAADVACVTVVERPRKQTAHRTQDQPWTSKLSDPSFLPHVYSEGKFAHVIYKNPKDMKRALRDLQQQTLRDVTLDEIEIQTLADTSHHRLQTARTLQLRRSGGDSGGDDDDNDEPSARSMTGVLAVAQQYMSSCRLIERPVLMKECDAIMRTYEQSEITKKRMQEKLRNRPDDDGFVTVSYSSAVGTKAEMEQSEVGISRRKGGKRSRKTNKQKSGSSELDDFYRFQRKEQRKRTLDELRDQFEEDLKQVKRMKEEKQYRPF